MLRKRRVQSVSVTHHCGYKNKQGEHRYCILYMLLLHIGQMQHTDYMVGLAAVAATTL